MGCHPPSLVKTKCKRWDKQLTHWSWSTYFKSHWSLIMYLFYNFSYDCGSLIVYLIFLWLSKFNHVYFIFWQSSKCDHVFYISTIIEVWSCILYFDSCWSLIMLSYILMVVEVSITYFIFWKLSKCDHVFYISTIIEVWSCYLIFW